MPRQVAVTQFFWFFTTPWGNRVFTGDLPDKQVTLPRSDHPTQSGIISHFALLPLHGGLRRLSVNHPSFCDMRSRIITLLCNSKLRRELKGASIHFLFH
ncbi:hypothetical protein AVEN_165681-1 [Araneus ventricosus]|uniref:Uncharacterized protein n=1 Tax=Araneus ventricosus TaxID=182803 RepID=A0A4Y2C335_ARAVE|nr:hypothetical protein AVEN_165681-1 [Araneus ventricosus]